MQCQGAWWSCVGEDILSCLLLSPQSDFCPWPHRAVSPPYSLSLINASVSLWCWKHVCHRPQGCFHLSLSPFAHSSGSHLSHLQIVAARALLRTLRVERRSRVCSVPSTQASDNLSLLPLILWTGVESGRRAVWFLQETLCNPVQTL